MAKVATVRIAMGPGPILWFVRFDHPNIATVVVIAAKPVAAGLEARRRRQRDHDEQTITCVRAFDGNVVRAP